MSRGALLAIGIVCLLGAAAFVACGIVFGPKAGNGLLPFFGMAIFCGLITTACFFETGRGLTVRLIGLVIFVVYFVYLITSGTIESFLGFIVFGLPAGYVAITARYPNWGRGSSAFDYEDSE
jgi:hypothetical protein